jgi:hypothetical protein
MQSTHSYLAALQSIGLFGLQLKRVSSLIGALAFCILYVCTCVGLPTPEHHADGATLCFQDGCYDCSS